MRTSPPPSVPARKAESPRTDPLGRPLRKPVPGDTILNDPPFRVIPGAQFPSFSQIEAGFFKIEEDSATVLEVRYHPDDFPIKASLAHRLEIRDEDEVFDDIEGVTGFLWGAYVIEDASIPRNRLQLTSDTYLTEKGSTSPLVIWV